MSIFDEKYRVVGIESDRLMVRGVHTGDVLTILNPEPATPHRHAPRAADTSALEVSEDLTGAMKGLAVSGLDEAHMLQTRGW
jgi:pyridoxal 5'-phosphate synthase pdxS subunit